MNRCRLRVARRSERGAATTELVIATPLLLLLIMATLQFALWQHANHVALAAAQEGARSARLEGGTVASGHGETQSFLNQLGNGLIVNQRVAVTRDATTARVEVSGDTESVIPFLSLPVRAVSQSDVERYTSQAGG